MNNRQLKFRAWDKLAKQFTYPDKGYQGHYVLTLNGQFQNLQNGSGGDEYIIQQWTGLKDKNGKEIYEGDRVTYKLDKHYYFSEIKWGHTSWLINDVNAAFPLSELPDLEIIGNIFQLPCNPDHNGECLVCDCWLSDCPFLKKEKTEDDLQKLIKEDPMWQKPLRVVYTIPNTTST